MAVFFSHNREKNKRSWWINKYQGSTVHFARATTCNSSCMFDLTSSSLGLFKKLHRKIFFKTSSIEIFFFLRKWLAQKNPNFISSFLEEFEYFIKNLAGDSIFAKKLFFLNIFFYSRTKSFYSRKRIYRKGPKSFEKVYCYFLRFLSLLYSWLTCARMML